MTRKRDPNQEYLAIYPKLSYRWARWLREGWNGLNNKKKLYRLDRVVDEVFEGHNPAHVWAEVEGADLVEMLMRRDRQ